MRRPIGLCLLGLIAGLAGASCRSLPPAMPAARASNRAPMIEPVASPGKHLGSLHIPPPAAAAAAGDGLNWLMAHPLQMRNSPYPVAVTAIAFCAAIRDPRMQSDSEFRDFWLQEIEYIVSEQGQGGWLSEASDTVLPYEHAWAARALCDALEWQPDGQWEQAAQRAINLILDHQQPGGGWHYGYANVAQRSTPLTVVQMDALHAARQASLQHPKIDDALQRAAKNLVAIQDPYTGHFGYLMRGVGTGTMDGFALVGLQLAGHWRSLAYRRGWLARLESTTAWPEALQYPLFAAYYSHKSALRQGGLAEQTWVTTFYGELLEGQQPNGAWRGPRQEQRLGQAYATALASLMILSVNESALKRESRSLAELPGPVYTIDGEIGSVHIILSTWIEDFDAVLLDPVIYPELQQADQVWIEGWPRTWIQQWMEEATRATGASSNPPTSEQVRFLRRWFDAPIGTPASLWEDVPTWALALAVWGHGLEQASRSADTMVEAAVARRLRPGMRPQAMLADDHYATAFSTLSLQDQEIMLEHTIRLAPQLATWIDQMADAWCRGDESKLARLSDQILGENPAVKEIVNSTLRRARATILLHIMEAAERDESTWFVIPTWHWFGEEGLHGEIKTLFQGRLSNYTDCHQ